MITVVISNGLTDDPLTITSQVIPRRSQTAEDGAHVLAMWMKMLLPSY